MKARKKGIPRIDWFTFGPVACLLENREVLGPSI